MSKLSRRKTRKLAFQKLYSSCFNQLDENNFKKSFIDWVFDDKIDDSYLEELISEIRKNEAFLLYVISKYSKKFSIEDMNIIYVLPCYISLAEMFFISEEIPSKVSINEAIEIAKTFWDESAKKIVNWVLNNVLKDFEELKKDLKTKKFNWDFLFLK